MVLYDASPIVKMTKKMIKKKHIINYIMVFGLQGHLKKYVCL